MSRFKSWSLLLWLGALSLGGWALTQLPLADIVRSITALTWSQWLAWGALNLAIVLLLGHRWWVLIDMLEQRVGFVRLLQIRQAGNAINFITPGPQFGGEPLQVLWLCQHCRLPLHKALLSLGLDRFYELWINFSVLVLGILLLLLFPASAVAAWQNILLIMLALLLGLSLLGWIMLRRPQWLSGSLAKLAKRWQEHPRIIQIKHHWQALGKDLRHAIQTRKKALVLALLLSLAGWAGMIGELALLLEFVDIQLTLPSFILVIVAMRLALLLPVPGGIGTLEAAVLWSFQTLNLPVSAAVALIALMRLRDAVILVTGLLLLRGLRTSTPQTVSHQTDIA